MKLALHWKILIGLVLGLAAGIIVHLAWAPTEILPGGERVAGTWDRLGVGDVATYFAGKASDANADAGLAAGIAKFAVNANTFAGQLFLRLLKLIAVPIVVFSLIVGASSLNDLKKLSRIGGKTIAIYISTTAIAITIGLVLANVVQPGRYLPDEDRTQLTQRELANATAKIEAAADRDVWRTILDIVPENPFDAIASGRMLQVVCLSLMVGIGLTLIPEVKARPIIVFFDGMTDVVIKLIHIIMLAAPYAVFALMANAIATLGTDVLQSLLAYCLVVVGGLVIMIFVFYPLVLRVFSGVGYRRFFSAMAPAQLLAFSSSSSSATLPVTMECAHERLGVSEDVSSFVLPLGATVNMDGTALYQGVAAVFIAQLYGLDLTIGQQLTIVLTATLASIGTAGVPGVGIIMLVIVLEAVHIPLEGIAVILGVDRLLDMCRTTCNVTGDAMVAAIVASSEKELLSEADVRRRLADVATTGLDEHPPGT